VVVKSFTNYGNIRQSEIQVGVAYESNLPLALAAIRDLVRANTRSAGADTVIQVVALADSAVQISIKPWVAVADYGAVAGRAQCVAGRGASPSAASAFPTRNGRCA